MVMDTEAPMQSTADAGKPRVLILDDEPAIRSLVSRTLEKNDYVCDVAASAEEARVMLSEGGFDVILSDIQLPGESGLSFVKWLSNAHPDIAVVMVTGTDDLKTAEEALRCGAHSYVAKPFTDRDLLINISGAQKYRKEKQQSREKNEWLEQEVARRTQELEESVARRDKSMRDIVKAMAAALETRDPYTAGHQHRVAILAKAIGETMRLDDAQLQAIEISAMIHDIGKISVPSEILTKPGRLTDLEFQLIKVHAETGYKILKEIDFPWPVAEIVYQHHERINGSGYPRQLNGDDLHLEAKIIAVADVVEAMASHRPYRAALAMEVALGEIRNNQGKLYDPEVATACLKLFEEKNFQLPA